MFWGFHTCTQCLSYSHLILPPTPFTSSISLLCQLGILFPHLKILFIYPWHTTVWLTDQGPIILVRETDCPSLETVYNPLVRDRGCEPFPPPRWSVDWLDCTQAFLMPSAIVAVSLSAVVLSCQKSLFYCPPWPLTLSVFLPPFLWWSLMLQERRRYKCAIWVSVPHWYLFSIVGSAMTVCVNQCTAQRNLWWGLRAVLLWRQHKNAKGYDALYI